MAQPLPATWQCPDCLRVNSRPDMRGRISNEYRCYNCGNVGLGAIPPGSFSKDNASFIGQVLDGSGLTGEPADDIRGVLLSIACPDFAHDGTGTATITLSSPAEKVGGEVITLTSGSTGKMTIPATVTVPQWAKSATVTVTGAGTSGTSLLTAAAAGSTSVTVTATTT